MTTLVDALMVTLGFDPSGMVEGTQVGEKALDGLAKKAMGVFAVLGGGALLISSFSGYLEAADAVGKLSDALGENASEMQAWAGAVALDGGSVEGFNSSLQAVNKTLVEMASGLEGEGGKILSKLGIDAKGANGAVKQSTVALGELADKFAGLSGQEALGLGAKLGLDQGTITLLRKGRVAIDEALKAQKELGEYTKKDIAAASAFNDSLDMTGKALSMVAARVFTFFAPALTSLLDGVRGVAVGFREWVESVLPAADGALAKTMRFFSEHLTVLKVALGVVTAFLLAAYAPAMWAAASATIAALWPLMLIVGALALVAVAIGALVDDFAVWRAGGVSAFGEVWQALSDFWDKVQPIVQALGAVWKAWVDLIMASAKFAFDFILNGWALLFGALRAPAEALFAWVLEKFAGLQGMISPLLDFFGLAAEKLEGLTATVNAAGAEINNTNEGAAASPAALGAASSSKSVTATQSIGSVVIQTQATDGEGVKKAFGKESADHLGGLVMASDSGVVQ